MSEPIDELKKNLDEQRKLMFEDDAVSIIEKVYQLWWRWANFELYVVTPTLAAISPPAIILPENLASSNEKEFVYPVVDYGFKLSTSKGEELLSSGLSMCKLFYTIEKIIFILMERLKAGGVTAETEVQVAFSGHELAQRKCFEVIINLPFNVAVTNFDPGDWGEQYLASVKCLSDRGYGYPPESPRDRYRHLHAPTTTTKP
jgi:hypothetical protein